MKKVKDVLGDVGEFFILAIRANLGINGEMCDYDGCWPEGATQAILFNLILGFCAGLILPRFGFSPKTIILWSFVIPVLYSFIVVSFLFGMIKEYLGIEFPTRNKRNR